MNVAHKCLAVLVLLAAAACTTAGAPEEPPAPPPAGCVRDSDCPGSVCDKSNDGDGIAEADDDLGVCVVFADECDPQRPCDAGAVCSDFFCQRTCEPPAPRGAACFFTSDTPRCEPMSTECADGLVCAVVGNGFGSDGECVPPVDRALDEFCDGDVCEAGLRCSDTTHRCVED